ncbi:MAG: replication-associated recombination protein A [Proteobacteria bacterium]|nr:MAG: replication-associated recombination protein A [Pseudomonadota bacterium]
MDLFSSAQSSTTSPLSEVLRPKNLDEIIGQEKTIGPNSKLGRMLRKGIIPSLIIWGPPGTGKTTFALALAQHIESHFVTLNAVDSGAKILREVGEAGRDRRLQFGQKTLLFVDEIHRFNKGQQDVLLSFLEKGDIILIGATTENPSYELNRALLSRSRVVIFERLSPQQLQTILTKVCDHYGVIQADIFQPASAANLIEISDGDARRLINSLEIIFDYFKFEKEDAGTVGPESFPLDLESLRELLQMSPLGYDKSSEMHYDVISAFIKSVRGTDPDAAVYYLARMLEGGEDPVFIARRLIILASEDVGNADPRALSLAVAGLQAVEAIGLPEAAITLSQVTTYLASCPKSNRSYMALNAARATVQESKTIPVPLHLRSSKTALSQELGYGKGYKYPHSYENGWTEQSYLPEELKEKSFYEPTTRGFEKNLKDYLTWVRGAQSKTPTPEKGSGT